MRQGRDLWYKDAIIYCLDVETYMDANGDGIGDFEGLIGRLDYLESLGVNCLWLLPFYPTPNRDNGYDVMNYYGVDERLGTLGDFVEFMQQARERGLRVIMDLVVNHTSNQHPWFQAARRDQDSKYRDYYVWSQTKPENADQEVLFPGVQESIWTYDEMADAYYLHRFYSHQPDLNIANPEVREEIRKIMGFWLELGVSGFRVDAAPYLIELKGIEDVANVDDRYQYVREFRDFLSWRRGDAILLAEANVTMDKVPDYFGDGNKIHMLFDFVVNQHLFVSLAREDAMPLVEGLHRLPPIPESGQWANFIRNHDELNLNQLTEEQQDDVIAAFAPDEDMRIYDRGIRRRLPPMLDGDSRRIRMAYSLMFSLPGSPVLRYGEEIGMGEDLSLQERNSVRTPMQWSDEKNAGFSSAPADELVRPVIDDGEYSYDTVNVDDQARDPDSLLTWMQALIRARKNCPEFGWGEARILPTEPDTVFAHSCTWRDNTVVAVHNFANAACTFDLDLNDFDADRLVDVLSNKQYEPIDGYRRIELDPYGYRWFRLK